MACGCRDVRALFVCAVQWWLLRLPQEESRNGTLTPNSTVERSRRLETPTTPRLERQTHLESCLVHAVPAERVARAGDDPIAARLSWCWLQSPGVGRSMKKQK